MKEKQEPGGESLLVGEETLVSPIRGDDETAPLIIIIADNRDSED